MSKNTFLLSSDFTPSADQSQAIFGLLSALEEGTKHQCLLGVTGSGKTFTMANVIAKANRPAMIISHNKTLAAQLYNEMREFFPNNAVEYFVSYYDYYQPEAYVPTSDTYIEKDASINQQIEQLRLSATRSILERQDTIIVATVSAIYGIGDPENYQENTLRLKVGDVIDRSATFAKLAQMQYHRKDELLERGFFRALGEVIEIFPGESDDLALRIHLFDDEIESMHYVDALTGQVVRKLTQETIYPKTHYAVQKKIVEDAAERIEKELEARLIELTAQKKLVERERLKQRVTMDLEMLKNLGYCNGIENYAFYFAKGVLGDPPVTLMDYLPDDALLFIDESHVSLPQLRAMYRGDRSRKETLVSYGFRLPSALENRPLRFEEFQQKAPQTIFISATPGSLEKEISESVVEQLTRPTGIIDPPIIVRPCRHQVDDLLKEIKACIDKKERALVTTLTKKMSEKLADYLQENGIKCLYLHSDIGTVERVEILRKLRLGEVDAVIGVNLLREGLDLPEVTLVAILDADKEGFLRSEQSLIQTIGRAARNIHGKAILYADRVTGSMKRTMDETERRRNKQIAYNTEHGITPTSVKKAVRERLYDEPDAPEASLEGMSAKERSLLLKSLKKEMKEAAKLLDFEKAATIIDRIKSMSFI